MEAIILNKAQARKIIINAAGLARKAQFGTGIEAVYRVIDHLGFVQLDTNYVIERAHHHAMAARVPHYQTDWLAELVDEGRIFEYFASDAGYLPMHDFRFSLPIKESFILNRKPLTPSETRLMKEVLDRIEREGPLTVGDFENDRQEASSGWWDWRPAKVALERLYQQGKLMITRSKNFQKLHDLPLNLVPAGTDLRMPTAEEYARYVIRRTLNALGIAYVKEMAWRARLVKGNVLKQELQRMIDEGEIQTVSIEGQKSAPLYMLRDQPSELELAGDAFILSPFDILNVFRHRLKDFFNFDYQIECFVPAEKRKYGYFSLPVLLGDRFIARLDTKADRKQNLLLVHNLYFEEVELDKEDIEQFVATLKDFVLFNDCRDIVFSRCNKPAYLEQIQQALS